MVQAAAVLSDYPEDVVLYVTDHRTGIQRTHKFPPTIAEIGSACDERTATIARQKELDDWHERKRKSDEIKANAPRYSAQENVGITYREHLARCEQLKIDPRVYARAER